MAGTLHDPETGMIQYAESIRNVADLMGIPAGTINHAYLRPIGDPDGTTLIIIMTPSE